MPILRNATLISRLFLLVQDHKPDRDISEDQIAHLKLAIGKTEKTINYSVRASNTKLRLTGGASIKAR